MALGMRRQERQREGFIAACGLPKSPGHSLCTVHGSKSPAGGEPLRPIGRNLGAPDFAEAIGRPGAPPRGFFRMLFDGYFEGPKSQRAISRRCPNSRSLC